MCNCIPDRFLLVSTAYCGEKCLTGDTVVKWEILKLSCMFRVVCISSWYSSEMQNKLFRSDEKQLT